MTPSFSISNSSLYTAGTNALYEFGKSAKSVLMTASGLPREALHATIGSYGDRISDFVGGQFQQWGNSFHGEFIAPPCSLETLKEHCFEHGLTSPSQIEVHKLFTQTAQSLNSTEFSLAIEPAMDFSLPKDPVHLQNLIDAAYGFEVPFEPLSFLGKLMADFTTIGENIWNYTSQRYFQFGFIFSMAAGALYSEGLNKKGLKQAGSIAFNLSALQLIISRYGIINTLIIQNTLSTFYNKGFMAGSKNLLRMATMRILFNASLAYFGGPITLSVLFGAVFLPIAYRMSQEEAKSKKAQLPNSERIKIEDIENQIKALEAMTSSSKMQPQELA